MLETWILVGDEGGSVQGVGGADGGLRGCGVARRLQFGEYIQLITDWVLSLLNGWPLQQPRMLL
ncbi:uncharacterized protein [Physcomitrium patens]|uniref:uncharacterized protein n=1 Tax=Physcomitrium patens TaxID=3218 RepID=UPI003CCE34D3